MALFSGEIPNLGEGALVNGVKIQNTVHVNIPLTAASTNQTIFIVPANAYKVLTIRECHGVAGGSGASASLEILTGTTANGSGTALAASATPLNGTANTVQTVTPTLTTIPALSRIGLVFAGTLTGLANCMFEVILAKV